MAIKWDEDWIRRSTWDLPTTLKGLRITLGSPGQLADSEALLRFLLLPAAEPMPKDLLREVLGFVDAAGRSSEVPLVVRRRLLDAAK